MRYLSRPEQKGCRKLGFRFPREQSREQSTGQTRERMGSPSPQTLRKPILVPPGSAFEVAACQTFVPSVPQVSAMPSIGSHVERLT
jgi:hypothetical protein